MKLLVTGGAGFIGSNFIRYWLDNHPEDEIKNFDALTYSGNPQNLKEVEANPRYSFYKGDITDINSLKKEIAGSDVVVHFAAQTHVDRSLMDSSVFFKTNVIGTKNLLEAALKAKIKKFINISTDEVFGQLDEKDESFDEFSEYAPRNPYSFSKAAADFLAVTYRDAFGLPVIITHSGNNYGPYQFPEKFIPLVIMNAMRGEKIPVYGDGRQIRNWVYVEDNVKALEAIIERGTIGERYCIGGEELQNIAVVKKILAILKKDEDLTSFVKDRPHHDRRYSLDSTKIKKELGWVAENNFDEGIGKTVSWYQENPEWIQNILNNEYREYYKKQYGHI